MVEGVEGIGEVVTGGMLAKTLEPEAGSAHGGHGDACHNCGASLQGEFCHHCGQRGHIHRTLSAFGHDIAHSVFHFDGKMWRTLPLLFWHPGELTRRYVEGERAKFVSPMAIFLFSVFLMFAVVSAFGGPFDIKAAHGSDEARQEFEKEISQSLNELNELKKERAELAAAGAETADVDGEIRSAAAELAQQKKEAREALAVLAALQKKKEAELGTKTWTNPILEQQQKEAAKAAGATEAVEAAPHNDAAANGDEGRININTGIPAVDRGIKNASENPALLAYKLQSNAYKFSWALIPISVPFVWLMFLHRRRYRKHKAYDHMVFVTYSIAFMSIGFIVLTLLRPLGAPEWIAGTAIAFGPPIHMYRQLRGAYQLSRFSALWRTALLLVFAFLAALLFFTLLMALGASD